jgi:hypothetical protein
MPGAAAGPVPPARAAVPQPPKKKNTWKWVVGIVAALVVIGAIAGGSEESADTAADGDSSKSSDTKKSDTKSSSNKKSDDKKKDDSDDSDESSGQVGEAVTNAGTTYKVTSARTASSIGDTEFLGATADGKFVIVNLELTNNKDETKTFTDGAAKVRTTDGNEYEGSNDAMMAFGDDSLFLKEIQPDLTTRGKLAFDIPPSKVHGSTLVIEDLFGRGEVTVDLNL